MYHVFTDKEFQDHQNMLLELNDLRRWKTNIEESAVRYIDTWADEPCARKDSYYGVCDKCPLGWIFSKCPTGKEKSFSK